jgi:metallo-beta-lactamase class B
VIADGDTLRVGPLAIVARFTPGHTPGGTSWSWRSCEDGRCLDLVYADSQTPVSADGFRFAGSEARAGFERSHIVLENLSCDVLLTPHPGASNFWERIASRDGGARDSLIDPSACKSYAAAARVQLAKRLAAEAEGRQ